MKKMALVVTMLLAVPLMAATPPEITIWTAADLKAQSDKLAQKLDAQEGRLRAPGYVRQPPAR